MSTALVLMLVLAGTCSGGILISVTSLAVTELMVLLFVLALLLPFPGGRPHGRGRRTP